MFIQELEIQNLRILESVSVSPGPGLNVLYGSNGSGKTSMLEAIHLLGVGRSFRSRHHLEMVRRGTEGFRVRGEICREAGVHRLGLELGKAGLNIRCDGQTVMTASVLARALPLVLFTPDSQRLMTEGANQRRQLLDWCLFHVEPDFLPAYQRFRRTLRQRNAALRGQEQARVVKSWDEEFTKTGESVHNQRARYVDLFLPTLDTMVSRLLPFKVTLEYKPGWPADRSLGEALDESFSSDMARGFTQVGPQRADLAFVLDGIAARKLMSRGESKLFVASIILAQVAHFIETMDRKPVILVDEVASELDQESRQRVFAVLASLDAQTFVTTVSRELIENGAWPPDSVFHVERGITRAVV